jgi:hypothetical protein
VRAQAQGQESVLLGKHCSSYVMAPCRNMLQQPAQALSCQLTFPTNMDSAGTNCFNRSQLPRQLHPPAP